MSKKEKEKNVKIWNVKGIFTDGRQAELLQHTSVHIIVKSHLSPGICTNLNKFLITLMLDPRIEPGLFQGLLR